MLIRVLHEEGYYDYVKPQFLDYLIAHKKIISFYRKTGVAVLGVHEIRSEHEAAGYIGPERRFNTLLTRPKTNLH